MSIVCKDNQPEIIFKYLDLPICSCHRTGGACSDCRTMILSPIIDYRQLCYFRKYDESIVVDSFYQVLSNDIYNIFKRFNTDHLSFRIKQTEFTCDFEIKNGLHGRIIINEKFTLSQTDRIIDGKYNRLHDIVHFGDMTDYDKCINEFNEFVEYHAAN